REHHSDEHAERRELERSKLELIERAEMLNEQRRQLEKARREFEKERENWAKRRESEKGN
ncbi:MAG TPA: protein TolA, partial [Verrucomicrobiales bacterium]|nr:protein TolA [Verrucomicrobiales bacterium]